MDRLPFLLVLPVQNQAQDFDLEPKSRQKVWVEVLGFHANCSHLKLAARSPVIR